MRLDSAHVINFPSYLHFHGPIVPRASIIWLAPAVKVERSSTPRLHLDRVRFAIGWHLGITLGVCMSGFWKFGEVGRQRRNDVFAIEQGDERCIVRRPAQW